MGRAKRLSPNEELVDFTQDAHHTIVHVDIDDVIAAWEDPAVQAVLDASRAAVSASRTTGRRIELLCRKRSVPPTPKCDQDHTTPRRGVLDCIHQVSQ